MYYKYSDLALFFENILSEKKSLLISIDGPGGSGKSIFAESLGKYLSKCQIIHFDDFYFERNNEHHKMPGVGNSFDWQRLERQILIPWENGEISYYEKYDWTKDEVCGKNIIEPEGVVILEGIYTSRREIRDYYDYIIWVEVNYNLRLQRGIERDGEAMRDKWVKEWMPKENEYIASPYHDPRSNADIIVSGDAASQKIRDVFSIIDTKINF